MKIKQTRQVRLDELLKCVWDNGINDIEFHSDNDSWIRIDDCGDLVKVYEVEESDLFTITEEVEVDERTKLNKMISIDSSGKAYTHNDMNIKQIISFHEEEEEEESFYSPCTFIYLQNEDGSIGELIWSKERGLNATNTEI